MKTTIYQINVDRDEKQVRFMGLEYIKRIQGSCQPNPNIYDKVYETEDTFNHLEEIYEKFNVNYPSGYKGHSVSVSDIVEVSGSSDIQDGFYFCDYFGFKKIDFKKEQCEMNKEQMEAENKITVIFVEPNKHPKLINISDSLEVMQALVGGNIEEYMPFDDEVAIICNEDGKLNRLEYNRAIIDNEGNVKDIIVGNFFIAYAPFDSEELQSLPDELIDKYIDMFDEPLAQQLQPKQPKFYKRPTYECADVDIDNELDRCK